MVSGLIFSWRSWPYFRLASTSYLKAVVTLATERAEFGEDLKSWMKEFNG